MSDAEFVVIRPAPDLPDGVLASHWDGCWFDRGEMEAVPGGYRVAATVADLGDVIAVPTGRFEVWPETDAVAEVYEVQAGTTL